VEAVLQSLMTGIPVFLIHTVVAMAVLFVAIRLYVQITPHKEIQMIKDGNVAAAISLSGATIGLAIPMGFCLAGSVNVMDIIIWGGVILVLQLFAYFLVDRMLGNISESIKNQQLAPVIYMVAIKFSVAILNAAAIAV
jgi:putative membrane protein